MASCRDGARQPMSIMPAGSGAELLGEAAAPEGPLTEEAATALEEGHFRHLLAKLRHLHPSEQGLRERPIGLALSGGGTRAAAFHCGVFWSMASAGLLKDVQHVCAVSGGGYTAASYVSHVCQAAAEAAPDRDGASPGLDAWYQRVAAQFILRMQCNINYLVETTPARLCRPPREDAPEEAGSSCCPRVLDLPLLIGALLGSMTASPLLLLLQTLWPIALSIEFWHGAALRGAWCDPTASPWESEELQRWFLQSLEMVAGLAVIAIMLGTLDWLKVCPSNAEHHRRYLCCRSCRHVFERGAICITIYTLLVLFALWLQCFCWGYASSADTSGRWVRALCGHYIVVDDGAHTSCSDGSTSNEPWYEGGGASLYLNASWVAQHAQRPSQMSWNSGVPLDRHSVGLSYIISTMGASVSASGIVLAGLGALVWRSTLLKWLLTIVGPLCYLYVVAHIARWSVFGPISLQMLFPMATSSKYSRGSFEAFYWVSMVGALLTLPVYDAVQKLAHLYYRRALKRAFFQNGRDISFEAIANSAYCPNIIFSACLHDYRKPWEGRNYSDFTMSSLFVGCSRTGFFGTPSQASLARLMTIAGAATDATVLLNADVVAIRFFLAVIALRFGDFLRLQPEGQMSRRVEWRIMDSFGGQPNFRRVVQGVREQHWISRWLQGLMDRMPAACPFIAAHTLLAIGATIGSHSRPEAPNCPIANTLMLSSVLIFTVVAALSFFAYFRPLQWLMYSPMIQQFQMLAMHRYMAVQPPPYIYISDGGLLEVLGILPLLRRRLDRIVVSDAAEDPELSMRCLRDALCFCRKEGLCSFYDPKDPCRDMEFVLQAFRESRAGFLHLGIRYESRAGDASVLHGELFYVRMLLPHGDDAMTRCLLTEQELLGAPRSPGRAEAAQSSAPQLRRDMSGVCCRACECGGFCVGRRFPDFGVGNQFLTPLHFANLCSLGAELSGPLVRAMTAGSA